MENALALLRAVASYRSRCATLSFTRKRRYLVWSPILSPKLTYVLYTRLLDRFGVPYEEERVYGGRRRVRVLDTAAVRELLRDPARVRAAAEEELQLLLSEEGARLNWLRHRGSA